MDQNICKFIPYSRHDESIHTLYFVYEQNFNIQQQNQILAFYKLCIVTSGNGSLHMNSRTFPLQKGDIFFIFPSVPHSIFSLEEETSADRLQCIYISFIGLRANQLMSKFHITSMSPVYSGYEEMIPFWENAILLAGKENLDILSESVLLYTLAVIGAAETEAEDVQNNNLIQSIRKYVDENFSDPDLSLNIVCTRFNYNPKYISTQFKKIFKTGFNEYITTIRIQEACTLMDENMTSVKDIAARCGFKDQYYFSRVFKKRLLVSPSRYIQEQKTSREV